MNACQAIEIAIKRHASVLACGVNGQNQHQASLYARTCGEVVEKAVAWRDSLNVPQLILRHSEIMAHLVEEGVAHLAANLFVGPAYGLDIFLVQEDVVRRRG